MHEIADNSKGGDTDASQDDTIRDLLSARWERAPPRHARAAAAGSQDKPLSSEPLGMLLMHTAGSDGWKMDTLLWLNRVFLLRPMFVQIRENNKNVYSAYMTRPKYFNIYHLPPTLFLISVDTILVLLVPCTHTHQRTGRDNNKLQPEIVAFPTQVWSTRKQTFGFHRKKYHVPTELLTVTFWWKFFAFFLNLPFFNSEKSSFSPSHWH